MAGLGFIKKALPWLGTSASLAVSGVPGAAPIVGIAAKLLSTHLNKPVDPTNFTDVLTEALGNPAELESLKQAELAYQQAMQQMNYQHESDMEVIAEKDRESARAMQVQTRSLMPALLALAAIATFSFCIYMLGFRALPPTGHDALMLLLGAVTAIVKDVYGYVFGSSAGSAEKTTALAQIATSSGH